MQWRSGFATTSPEENIRGRAAWPQGRLDTPGLEGTLWILNTGGNGDYAPSALSNYKTVHRRFQTWCRSEVLRGILMDIANELRERGALDEEECFIDATFVMAKGGGAEVGPTKRGKGRKSWRPRIATACRSR